MKDKINWTKQLNSIKEKATEARLMVLKLLEKNKKPISAEEVISQSKLDKATVYRVLNFLEDKSIIRLIDLRQGKRLYELNNNCHHHHIICTKCGTIKAIDICLFDNISKSVLEQSEFTNISDHSMEFFGLCQKCSKK